MKFIPALIFLQIIFSLILLNIPSSARLKVLGLSYLAQIETPTEAPTQTPLETPSSEASALPSASPETPTPGETIVPTEAGLPLSSPEPEINMQTQAVLEPSNTINSPENISQEVIDSAKEEDKKLDATADPEEKNNLLTEIASDQVKDLESLSDHNDFASANFTVERLNHLLETAIDNLDSIPDDKKAAASQKLSAFCFNSDSVLRLNQLSAPEEIQQDIEITRGLCQSI